MHNVFNNDILLTLGNALAYLIERDSGLISRKVKEEAVNHRLAVYIEQLLANRYDWLNVDVEYNKNYENDKEITFPDGERRFIRPDILVHSRGDNYNNKLAVECKLLSMDRYTRDKLLGLKKVPYCYENSVGVVYKPNCKAITLYFATENDLSKHCIEKDQLATWFSLGYSKV